MERQVHYVNQVVVVSSNFDVQLKMKSVSPLVNDKIEQTGTIVNEEVDIIMSLVHAKALRDALIENLGKNGTATANALKTIADKTK